MDSIKTTPKHTVRLRPTERRSTLLVGDFIVALFSLLLALYIWSKGPEWLNFSWAFLRERVPFWFYLLPFGWMLLLSETYSTRRLTARNETFRAISIAAGVSIAIYLVFFFLAEPNSLPRRGMAAFIVAAFVLTVLWRLLYIKTFSASLFLRRVLIVGAGRSGARLANVVNNIWPPPFMLVGMVDDDPQKAGKKVENVPVLGNTDQLFDLIQENDVSDLVFAVTGEISQQLSQSLLLAEEEGIEVSSMAKMYEEILGRVPITLLQSDWVLRSFVDQSHMGSIFELGKRLLDILGGLVGCIFLLITVVIFAPLILIDSGLPIFYQQTRLGRNGKPYNMLKFRTMKQDAEKDGVARPAAINDERATRIGRFLRKTHLDELPQVINVLKGEMSLVGPRSERPELVEELQAHIPFYRARLFVKPGLTGWAQVNYGYASNVEMNAIKLEYDLYYIKRRNLLLDIVILFRTIWTVIGLRGR
jgi:exopolysaccharide biosynthesis polyprenyl glycosylphosphotransferase